MHWTGGPFSRQGQPFFFFLHQGSLHKCVHQEQVMLDIQAVQLQNLCLFSSFLSSPLLAFSFLPSPVLFSPFFSCLRHERQQKESPSPRSFHCHGQDSLNTNNPLYSLPPPPCVCHVHPCCSVHIPLWAELWPRKQSFRHSSFQREMHHSRPLASECISALSNTVLKSAFYLFFPFSLPNTNNICALEKYVVLLILHGTK